MPGVSGSYSIKIDSLSRDNKVITIDVDRLLRENHADLVGIPDLIIKNRFVLEELQITITLPSLEEVEPPNVAPEDTDGEIKAKVEEVKRSSEIIRLGIFERSQHTPQWQRKAILRLCNYGGESYKSLIRPYFGRWPSVSLGTKTKIALAVLEKRKGDVRLPGFLGSEDSIVASVNYKDELTVINRPRMLVSRSRSFGVEVSSKSTQVVPFNKDRKVLLLTNAGSSPAFVSSGEQAELNKGFYLAAGGALTLEEGKYSVPLHFFGITAEDSTTLITGEEWM